MAAKLGPAALSYGIGVQNRYAAFLDDEDALTALAINNVAIVAAKRPVGAESAVAKSQKNPASAPASSKQPMGPRSNGAKTIAVKSGQNSLTGDQPTRTRTNNNSNNNPIGPDGRQRRSNQFNQGANNAVQAQSSNNNNHQNRHTNTRQLNSFNNHQTNGNNRFIRNNQPTNVNNHHQSNASHSNHNKENSEFVDHQQQGKFVRNNNPRTGFNQRRQFFNDDQKTHLEDGSGANPFNNSIAAQTEEEKRRRQQKRALDLKYKDPEKREARRQQPNTEQTNMTNGQPPQDGVETDKAARGFKGAGAPRVRGRRDGPGFESSGENRQNNDRPRQGPGDRPQRNRNGFNNGSRGSRSSRSDEHGKSDRPRPIPNFSDKLDFPSLAS